MNSGAPREACSAAPEPYHLHDHEHRPEPNRRPHPETRFPCLVWRQPIARPSRTRRWRSHTASKNYLSSHRWKTASISLADFSTLLAAPATLLAAFSVVLAAASTRDPAASTRVAALMIADSRSPPQSKPKPA